MKKALATPSVGEREGKAEAWDKNILARDSTMSLDLSTSRVLTPLKPERKKPRDGLINLDANN